MESAVLRASFNSFLKWLVTHPIDAFEFFLSELLESGHLHVDGGFELDVQFAIGGCPDSGDHLSAVEIFWMDRKMSCSKTSHISEAIEPTIPGGKGLSDHPNGGFF